MAEQLYTIPVNDAFTTDCECPICEMNRQLERNAIEYTMGPSYMEDDNLHRPSPIEQTREEGFSRLFGIPGMAAQNIVPAAKIAMSIASMQRMDTTAPPCRKQPPFLFRCNEHEAAR